MPKKAISLPWLCQIDSVWQNALICIAVTTPHTMWHPITPQCAELPVSLLMWHSHLHHTHRRDAYTFRAFCMVNSWNVICIIIWGGWSVIKLHWLWGTAGTQQAAQTEVHSSTARACMEMCHAASQSGALVQGSFAYYSHLTSNLFSVADLLLLISLLLLEKKTSLFYVQYAVML